MSKCIPWYYHIETLTGMQKQLLCWKRKRKRKLCLGERVEAEAEAEAFLFKMVEVEAEAEAISFQIGQLEAEAEAVQKSTASASLVFGSNPANCRLYNTWQDID